MADYKRFFAPVWLIERYSVSCHARIAIFKRARRGQEGKAGALCAPAAVGLDAEPH
jgi:hypothetical protein